MAAIGAYVSGVKRRAPVEGFILGLLMGPLGVVVAALLPTIEGPKPSRRPKTFREEVEEEEELPEIVNWRDWVARG